MSQLKLLEEVSLMSLSGQNLLATPAATAFGFIAGHHAIDYSCCAAHTGCNRNGLKFTVVLAGSAFNAPIAISHLCFLPVHHKHAMGTNLSAPLATGTLRFIIGECHHILQVFHMISQC